VIGPPFPEVLDAARLGAEWAWAELFDDLAGAVAGYLRSRGAPDPEDAVSEVFHSLAKGIGGFQGGEEQFRAWVFTIARSRMIDQRRALGRRPLEPLAAGYDAADPGSDPAAIHESTAAATRAVEMLASLTPDQAEVVALRVFSELSLHEVALVMGRNVNTIKQLQHRALRSLRRRFSDEAVTR
jgi:RNA polymerase sigma-70 factor (ECF subfamily)